MNKKTWKGIALILFGILLCLGSEEFNSALMSATDIIDYVPFAVFGLISGVVGLVFVFTKEEEEK